jgi:HEAT repeat protein
VAKVLAEELGQAARSDYVRAFLIRELQWIGDKETLPALANCLTSDALCQPAVTAMLAIGEGAEDPLRKALPAAAGPRHLAILHGLADLADAQSADAFLKALEDQDESIRLSAAWGLSQLADPAAIDPLLKSIQRPAPASYERTKMLSAGIQMAERLAKAGKKKDAAKIFRHLTEKCTGEKEDYLRELATRALAELG